MPVSRNRKKHKSALAKRNKAIKLKKENAQKQILKWMAQMEANRAEQAKLIEQKDQEQVNEVASIVEEQSIVDTVDPSSPALESSNDQQ